MEVIDLINELKDFRNKGFLDCNIEAILLKLKKIEYGKKVKIPKFVAEWVEKCKVFKELVSLSFALNPDVWEENRLSSECITWLTSASNQEKFARAWLDGYEIEEEKRYEVKLKNTDDYLVKTNNDDYRFYNNIYTTRRKHTREELEDAGFGWVLDCKGMEVKEVEE